MASCQSDDHLARSSWGQPRCLIESAKDGQFEINEETLSMLHHITDSVVVVAIVGLYRTGKSHLINRLAGKPGFDLGSTIQSKTKGIWDWAVRHPIRRNCSFLLLDTEGLGDVEKRTLELKIQKIKTRFRHTNFDIGRRRFSAICAVVSFLTFFSPKNGYVVYGYDSATFNIRKNVQDSVRFNFTTDSKSSVDWQFKKTSDSKRVDIFIGNARGGGGQKSNLYASRNRYQIEMDINSGRYDLLVNKVSKIDEGFYECSDVSNPDSSTIWKLVIIGEEDEELCSNDVTAIVGETVQLIFPTTKKASIQLEHRSVDRSYPLHVYRDGRLVNDYFALDGRYLFSSSNNGSWTLVIQNVRASDAGSFVCSEDNGLGQQYAKELVVLKENDVSCSTENETCADEFNVTCKATYAGNSAPRLRFSTEGGNPRRNETRIIIIGNSVSLMTVADRTHVPLCVVETQSTLLKSTCQMPVCNGTSTEQVSYHNIGLISSIITLMLIFLIIIVSVIFVYVKRKIFPWKWREILCQKENSIRKQRQKTEASERERRAAEEEIRKKEQLIEDQKKSHEDHIQRVEKQIEEDRKKMREDYEKVLEKRLHEQERLLKEGFDQKANAMKADNIDGLRQTIEEREEDNRDGGFLDFLGNSVPPVIQNIIRYFTK